MQRLSLLSIIIIIISLSFSGFSKTTQSVTSGYWDVAGTWDNGAPSNNDIVVIKTGHTVTLRASVTNPGISINVQSGGTLTSAGSNYGIYIKTGGYFTVYGTINVYSIDVKNNVSPNYIYDGGDVTVNYLFDHANAGGTLTVDGTLTVLNPGTLINAGTINGTGTISAANWTNTGTVFGVTGSITAGTTMSGFTWNGGSGTTWDTGSNWSQNTAPSSSTHDVVIPTGLSNYPVISDAANLCGNLTIQGTGSLTINPGADVAISGTLTATSTNHIVINSTASGTGSLYHTSNDVQATIKRYVTGNSDLTQDAYHLVSVPLRSDNSNLFSNLFFGSYLFDFVEGTGDIGTWTSLGTSTTTALSVAKGYMIYYPGSSTTYSFPGKLNNGLFNCTVDYTDASHGFNLVPNPYSFDIDWNSGGWSYSSVGNTICIWNPSAKNYGAYIRNDVSGTNGVTNKIAVGQAFFVQATGGSPTLSMTNAVKTTGATFLKETSELSDQLFIKVSAGGYGDEAIVRFRADGSVDVDPQNDAAKFFGSEVAPQLYTLAENEKLSINSLPYSFDEVLVTLGVDYISNESCTLSFEDLESFSSTISIQLQDLVTGELINLRQNPSYTFNYNTGDDPERFVLHFNGVTGTEDLQQEWAHVYKSGDKLIVDLLEVNEQSGSLEVFNTSGQKLFSTDLSSLGQQAIDFNYPRGLYMVRLTMNDQVIIKKIIQ